MKRTATSFLAALALAVPALVPLSGDAAAQVRKDVSEYAGQRCSTPPRGSGVTVGWFSGMDDSPFVGSNDGYVAVSRYRCFSSMSECRGWLYTMQSKYTNAGPASIARCDKR